MHRNRITFKDAVNDAIRCGLSPSRGAGAREPREPYRVMVNHSPLQPGIDRAGFNKLADDLEDEAILARLAERAAITKP